MFSRYLLSYTDAQPVVFTEAMNTECRGAQLRPSEVGALPGGILVACGPAPCCC